MELETWNASLLHVVIDQLCVLPVNSWLDVLSIYRQSRIVGHWNRIGFSRCIWHTEWRATRRFLRRDEFEWFKCFRHKLFWWTGWSIWKFQQ